MPAKDATFNEVTVQTLTVLGGGVTLMVDANHGCGVYAGAFDPVGAFDPQPGSLYLRRVDDTHGEVYAKTGAGANGWVKVAG